MSDSHKPRRRSWRGGHGYANSHETVLKRTRVAGNRKGRHMANQSLSKAFLKDSFDEAILKEKPQERFDMWTID